MTPRRIFPLVLALSLSGCISLGTAYHAPNPNTPNQWKNAPLLANTLPRGDIANWWKSFNDPVLDQLIEQALKQNPDLKSAQAKLRESRARAGVSQAALYPSLDASLGAKRTESGQQSKPSYSYNAGLDASWELDIFGAKRSANDAAEATAAASEASLQDAQVSLVAELATDYIKLRTLQARYQVANNSLASQQETRDLTRWRWQAGLVSELDYTQAESTLAQTRSRLPTLEQQIETARNQLAVLLGVAPDQLPDLAKSQGIIPNYSSIAEVRVPLDTLRQRPDLRAAERQLAAQAAQLNVAEAARFPSLSLNGSIGFQASDLHKLLDAHSLVNSLAASLTAPIFDAGKIKQNIAIQNALLDQSLASYEKNVLQALSDVENAMMALAKTEATRADLAQANINASSAEQLARQRYAAGLVDYLTVLETQRTLLSVQDSLRSAEGERASALVQLYKALGGGWQAPRTPEQQGK